MLTMEHCRNEACLVTFDTNRIDISNIDAVKSRFVDFINEGHNKFALNLSNVTFLDSAGLGALISTLRSLKGKGGIALFGVNTNIRSVLKMTHMDRIFPIYNTVDDALDSFTS
ncbi:STAS domain-containing protein [Desulfovibrio inopinatus]|uniref:STAS domain-containing protein n=1 Tax=Desulfovibrio inopinatus TaxID=102109 RepID=UPI000411B270|nr:STAS domain-containing protein [Desulfovibrio inopinatus]